MAQKKAEGREMQRLAESSTKVRVFALRALAEGTPLASSAGKCSAWARNGMEMGKGWMGMAENTRAMVDVDCNLTHEVMKRDVEKLIRSAENAGVGAWVVPGATIKESLEALELAEVHHGKIWPTIGVHPYNAATERSLRSAAETVEEIEKHLRRAVALGECGLDYSEGFPDREEQMSVFEPQVELACKHAKPLFLHERLAHDDFTAVLSKFRDVLPPVLVHCFTGSAEELSKYIELGFFVSFSGLICRETSGKQLRDSISQAKVPLDRIMIETDAPYLGFQGCRRAELDGTETAKERKKIEKSLYPNVPSALPQVLTALAKLLDVEEGQLRDATIDNAEKFFGMALHRR